MKLSLRNLALGATLCVAGAAMAQDAPFTVTQNWKIEADKTLAHSSGVRFGTGTNGKIYVPDKSDNKLAVISYVDGAAKIEKVTLNWEGLNTLGVGAGSDEAGNILLHKDFPNANTSTDFLIVTPEGEQIPLQITLPEGVEKARMDQIGRIAGNMMSEDGGWLFLTLNGANTVTVVKIANGEQVLDPISYSTSEPVDGLTLNTSSIVQPLYTGAELNDMGDDAITGWAARNRSTQTIYLGDGSTLVKPAGANSPEGFDVFMLEDKIYQVQPIKVTSNYEPGFVIADGEGNIVYTATYENMGNGGQSFGGFTAHKVSDSKVELYQIYTSGAGNNYAMYTIEIPGETPVELPQAIFLRGEMNDWAAEWSYAFMPVIPEGAEAPVANENGEYEYSLYLDALMGEFRLGGQAADWSDFNYGAQGVDPVVTADCTKQAWLGSSENFKMNDLVLTDVTLNFYYNPDASKPSWLKIAGTEYVEPAPTTDKGHFAYDLKAEKVDGSTYSITFKSTGDAAKAVLVLTADGVDTEAELGEVKKGENTFTFDAKDLAPEKSHNWAVRLHNYKVEGVKISEPVNVGGNRAGLVVFTDPEYPEVFGKVVIGRTANGGIDIYDAEGKLEAEGLFKGTLVTGVQGTANNSSPMDGKQRGTEALLASWGDSAYGVVAVDIADLNQAPYSVFEGVKEGSGKIMNGDVATGSGTPCVALVGEGDETLMFTFDEDVFGNQLAFSRIGTAKTVGTALESAGFGSRLANTNIAMWGMKNGLFLSQVRANGMESAVSGLMFYDPEKEDITWCAADMATEDEKWLPSTAAGVCVNPAGDLLAVSTYTGFEIMLLSWDGNKPVLEKYMTIESPYATGSRTNIQFDAANNLHVTNQANGYYTVTLPEEEPIALTAAKSDSFIANTTGVENIAVEAVDAEAAYYNLNGVRVAADTLTPGVYVKVVGKVATKVVVK